MQFASLFEFEINAGIAELAKYCAEISGPADLPRRSRFRPSRVASVITYLFLIDVVAGENDYRFDLLGSNMAILFGEDVAGKRLSELGDKRLYDELRKTYDQVVTTGRPLYVRGRYEWPEMSIEIERLLVPMTDETGNVTTILGAAIPDIPADTLLIFAGYGPARLVIDEVLSAQ